MDEKHEFPVDNGKEMGEIEAFNSKINEAKKQIDSVRKNAEEKESAINNNLLEEGIMKWLNPMLEENLVKLGKWSGRKINDNMEISKIDCYRDWAVGPGYSSDEMRWTHHINLGTHKGDESGIVRIKIFTDEKYKLPEAIAFSYPWEGSGFSKNISKVGAEKLFKDCFDSMPKK